VVIDGRVVVCDLVGCGGQVELDRPRQHVSKSMKSRPIGVERRLPG
jgi:hypothetical protein